jgi:predicted transcriptional regulator
MNEDLRKRLLLDLDSVATRAGLRMSDVLELPDTLCQFVNWMLRNNGVSLAEVGNYLDQDHSTSLLVLRKMVKKGFIKKIKKEGKVYYQVRTDSVATHRISYDV